MSKIEVLSAELANQIAAGEVIERPASVVKELVENAIDAASTSVVVRLFDAGRTKIIVEDDVSGMEKSDAVLAFERHATSKLHDEFDLFRIKTLGFRGEALPSIASIAKVTLTTSTGLSAGTKVIIENNQLRYEKTSSRQGTTVVVEELFFNTRARLKYLKQDYTENANSTEVVQRLALAHPEVAIQLYIDDRSVFQTTGRADLLEVIMNLYGSFVAKRMRPFAIKHNDFSVTGYLGKAELMKSNRYSIITLLNGRNVYMPRIQKAIIDAYQGFIPPSRFPFVVLHFTIDPTLVDVNVHPSKREVRFSKEKELENLLLVNIPLALREDDQTVQLQREQPAAINTPFNDEQIALDLDYHSFNQKDASVNHDDSFEPNQKTTRTYLSDNSNDNVGLESKDTPYIEPFAQIGRTYIIAHDGEGGFYLIDQHAAAERINYEDFQKTLNATMRTREPLVPLVIDLSSGDVARLTVEKIALLKSVGIELIEFGPHTYKVVSIPLWASEYDERLYVNDLIDQAINDQMLNLNKIRTHAIATMACKASIKANHHLNIVEMQYLIKELLKCENPFACPHGRPTIIHIDSNELAKWFKRTGL